MRLNREFSVQKAEHPPLRKVKNNFFRQNLTIPATFFRVRAVFPLRKLIKSPPITTYICVAVQRRIFAQIH